MTPDQKAWIDTAPLASLLHKWRFSALGTPWFTGECGEYFVSVMEARRAANPEEWTRASKAVGWDR